VHALDIAMVVAAGDSVSARVGYTVVTIALLAAVCQLQHWNLLDLRYLQAAGVRLQSGPASGYVGGSP
jgi:hypothetical protein